MTGVHPWAKRRYASWGALKCRLMQLMNQPDSLAWRYRRLERTVSLGRESCVQTISLRRWLLLLISRGGMPLSVHDDRTKLRHTQALGPGMLPVTSSRVEASEVTCRIACKGIAMGWIANLLGVSEQGTIRTCKRLYSKAKRRRPNRDECDYLKLVLLTKPPFDYQRDEVIKLILDSFQDIDALAQHIANGVRDPHNWASRAWNLEYGKGRQYNVEIRNAAFFRDFWA